MNEIIAAIFEQQMRPKQIEVDEMGMGGGSDPMNSLASMLMSGGTDSAIVPRQFAVNTSYDKKGNPTMSLNSGGGSAGY